MLLGLEVSILPREATNVLPLIHLRLLLCAAPGLSQKAQPEASGLPKYDLPAETTKTEGVAEEVNRLPVETRKDITELIIKSGDDRVHIYVRPNHSRKMWTSASARETRSPSRVHGSSRKRRT